MSLFVTVDDVLLDRPGAGGTIIVFSGQDEDGRQVIFGVDHRVAEPLAQAVLLDEYPEVEVEDWQVLSSG